MGWKTNLALLVIVGGMGAYLWTKKDERPEQPDQLELTQRLLPKGLLGVREIKIHRGMDMEPVLLSLDIKTARFRIVDPVDDVASMAWIQALVQLYDGALYRVGYSKEDLAKDPELVKKTGLDHPSGQIEFRYRGPGEQPGESVFVEFGAPGVLDNEIFIRVRGEIHRTDAALHKALQRNPDDYRERVVFTEQAIGGLQKMRIEQRVAGEMVVYTVERGPDGYVTGPDRLRADRKIVSGLLGILGSLQVQRFISGAIAEIRDPSQKPDYVITLQGDNGAETVEVTRLESGELFAYASRRNIVFRINAPPLGQLEPWLPLLRDKRLLRWTESEVRRLEIRGAARQSCLLVRSSVGSFKMASPAAADDLGATPLGELLHAMTTLEAVEFPAEVPADAGLGKEALTVLLDRRTRGGRPIEIRFGRSVRDGFVYAQRVGEPAVVVPAAAMRIADRPWTVFLPRKLPALPGSAFRVEVRTPGVAAPIVYVREGRSWTGADPSETGAIGELADALRSLRAADVVATSEIPAGSPVAEVVLRREPSEGSSVLFRFRMSVDTEAGGVLILRGDDPAYAHRVTIRPFRMLLDRWLARRPG